MERLQRLQLLEEKLAEKNHFGRRLLSINQLALDGRVAEAADALRAAIAESSEGQRNANLALLLGACFAVQLPELAGGLLAARFCPDCQIAVRTSPAIAQHFLVLVAKVRDREISLTYSSTLGGHSELEMQMDALSWIMPFLARIASSAKVSRGMGFLNQWDAGIVPGLAYCASGSGFFLIPDNNVFVPSHGYDELKQELANRITPWSERTPIAYWRGSTTGAVLDASRGWRSLQRIGLCEFSLRHPRLVDAGLSAITQWSGEAADEMRSSGLVKDYFPANQLHRFRYLIDVDGNSNAWGGFFKRLLTGSPVLKIASPRGYKQWYYDRLRPWHNFVPVAADMSDLLSKIDWLSRHDSQARKIGENGRTLAYSIDYESELESALDTVAAAFRAFSAARGVAARAAHGKPRIYTHHGTVLAYNPESSALVHVAPELMFLNSPLTLDVADGHAYLRTATGEYLVAVGSEGRARTTMAPVLESVRGAARVDGKTTFLTFEISDRFMCAEIDGRVTVTRPKASLWESFRIESEDFADE